MAALFVRIKAVGNAKGEGRTFLTCSCEDRAGDCTAPDYITTQIWLDSIKFVRRKAVTTGLYKSIVIAAFSPPLIKLNGKNAGINNSTMASLG